MTPNLEQERPKQRIAIFATMTFEKTNERLSIEYGSIASDKAVAYIPMQAVENRVPIIMPNEDRCFIISDADVEESQYRLSMAFAGDRQPVPPTEATHIEVVDMVEQGMDAETIRAHMQSPTEGDEQQEQENENMDDMNVNQNEDDWEFDFEDFKLSENDPTPDEAAVNYVEMVEADEEPAPISPAEEATADMVEDWDDSVPVFSSAAEQTKSEEAGDEVTVETPKNTDTAWDGALLSGGRENDSTMWRFNPRMAPCFVMDEDTGQMVRVNDKDGNPAMYALLNPSLKSVSRPAGANLASGAVTNRYGLLDHPTWVDPILRAAADVDGVQAWVTSWKEGAKCRVDLDVSHAAQTRQKAANRMNNGSSFLDLDAFSELSHNLNSLYKFGFAIQNSIDGRGAFEAHGMALRLMCSNLASVGNIQSIIRAKHTKNVIAGIDYATFGQQMVDATVELNEWLVNTELMSFIPLEVQLFDRLMVASETHGLMTLPQVRFQENGGVDKVSGGYLWRVIGDGYAHSAARPHVNVEEHDANTLYSAYQAYTGAYTHRPKWTSGDGKTTMEGNKVSIDALTKRLKTTDNMMKVVAQSGLRAASKALERPLTLSDKDEVKSYLHAHPEVLMVPVKNGRSIQNVQLDGNDSRGEGYRLPTMNQRLGIFTE